MDVRFETHPSRYRRWKLSIDGAQARLALDVPEDAGIAPGYALKLNSYDLGVDIELADALQRIRFEHPSVRVLVIESACSAPARTSTCSAARATLSRSTSASTPTRRGCIWRR